MNHHSKYHHNKLMLMLLLCWFLRHPNKLRAGSLYWKFLSKILTIINWVGRYKLSCKNILLGKWDNKLTVIVFILPICIRLGQRFWRNSIGEYLMIMSSNSSESSQVLKMLSTSTDFYFVILLDVVGQSQVSSPCHQKSKLEPWCWQCSW